jgi:hypothetical protein
MPFHPPDRKPSPSSIGSLPSSNLQVVKPERIQKRYQTQYTPKEEKENQKLPTQSQKTDFGASTPFTRGAIWEGREGRKEAPPLDLFIDKVYCIMYSTLHTCNSIGFVDSTPVHYSLDRSIFFSLSLYTVYDETPRSNPHPPGNPDTIAYCMLCHALTGD